MEMPVREIVFGRIILAAALAFAVTARAQDYPGKPIKTIVPVSPGGTIDR